MGYRNLRQCVDDLERGGHLVRLEDPVDARLEAAEIHRRVYRAGGPAIFFANVKDCRFPMVSNLFGTLERSRFMFRDTLEDMRKLVALKIDPMAALRHPWEYWKAPLTAFNMLPRMSHTGPCVRHQIRLSELPQLQSWPADGGAFVTLPLVYTENVDRPGLMQSNLGMYRIQYSGNAYSPDREVGLHYQLHRGIGIHHQLAHARGKPFRVNTFVGGAPAMTLAAVMPLPEGLAELTFAGALGGHRITMVERRDSLPVYAEADFCISGVVDPKKMLPEGPFGDHLGYYSLAHDFPVLQVEKVYHRPDAIWPFTVVGRPPQEDTSFGALIHEITGPVIPSVLKGVQAVHAVDAAGVHPLLLAIGSERYTPYQEIRFPQEILTQANAILGQGQLSLAKYLWIANGSDDPTLDIHDIRGFFEHMLRRVDWGRDLHFQTNTTIDTLDYSGSGLNRGSKLVIAAAGPARRELPTAWPPSGCDAPPEIAGFRSPRVCFPGVLAIEGPAVPPPPSFTPRSDAADGKLANESGAPELLAFCQQMSRHSAWEKFPLVVVVDDSQFVASSLNNFLWVAFTRSDPATDIHGVDANVLRKHWGCRSPLVIDARIKPHHAPALSEDPEVTRRVDALAARGGPLARWL
ncbi:MAG: UbiD family decarboxylase [Pirellulales bacterium]